MSVDILGTNCDQCGSMVQCCFTSIETIRLVRLRFRLPTLASVSVFVCLCGSATVVCTLTVCAVFHAIRVKVFVVL